MYDESRKVEHYSMLRVESMTLNIGYEYCITNNLLQVMLDTDSLTLLKKILYRTWGVPWVVTMEIRQIKLLMSNKDVDMGHIQRRKPNNKFFS